MARKQASQPTRGERHTGRRARWRTSLMSLTVSAELGQVVAIASVGWLCCSFLWRYMRCQRVSLGVVLGVSNAACVCAHAPFPEQNGVGVAGVAAAQHQERQVGRHGWSCLRGIVFQAL
jgi:hypothetical protein